MESVKVIFPSKWHHCCQIAAGFLPLRDQGWKVEIVNDSGNTENTLHGKAFVQAQYRGKKIVYDMLDGYLDLDAAREALKACDFYFKRSFSEEKNRKYFPEYLDKIHPLGFNYHVTHRKNPINESFIKRFLKPLQGRAPDIYFTAEVFEGTAAKIDHPPKILFLTRL